MIKKAPYGTDIKAQLRAASRDKLYKFLLDQGKLRGAVLHGTRMINEMRANHELGILETVVLGRAYLGCGLLSADLKGQDRLSLQIDCSGPIKGLFVETNAFGDVRGYLKVNPIPVENPLEDLDLSPFFGAGLLTMTRVLEDAKAPFTGQVALEYGNLALDLANYFVVSEQIPTAFNLSIHFDPQGHVIGAGGFYLQAMPSSEDEHLRDIETCVRQLPSLGKAFATGHHPEDLIRDTFGEHDLQLTDHYRVEFMCHCNADHIQAVLGLLPISDLTDLAENGPFPVAISCVNCNTPYLFEQNDIRMILDQRFSKN